MGITEETEHEHEPKEQDVLPPSRNGSRRCEHPLDASADSSRRSSFARVSVTVIATEEVDLEDLTLTVDASSSHLDVLECEPSLPAVDFMSCTQRLLDWVPVPKRRKFQVWVRASTDQLFGENVPQPLRVHLIPPHMRSS